MRKNAFAAVAAGLGLVGCVTVPVGESIATDFGNGVYLVDKQVQNWEGLSPMDQSQEWARNTTSEAMCVGLIEAYGKSFARTWLVPAGRDIPMFPEQSKYNSSKGVSGRYTSWRQAADPTCSGAGVKL